MFEYFLLLEKIKKLYYYIPNLQKFLKQTSLVDRILHLIQSSHVTYAQCAAKNSQAGKYNDSKTIKRLQATSKRTSTCPLQSEVRSSAPLLLSSFYSQHLSVFFIFFGKREGEVLVGREGERVATVAKPLDGLKINHKTVCLSDKNGLKYNNNRLVRTEWQCQPKKKN